MNIRNTETKIINFIEDFGCIKEKQLSVLFDCDKSTIKNILHTHFINKKGDVYVHKHKTIDKKILAAIDVLCEYKGRFKQFYKNFEPIYITFLSKSNELYNIIVSEKADEKGIIKMLKNKPSGSWNCDKLIILFEDTEMVDKIEIDIPYLYCTYSPVQIVDI